MLLSLTSYRYPVDGWMSSPSGTTFTQGGQYELMANFSGLPSPLRTGDVITAIDGRPLAEGALPPLPSDLHFGQTLRYAIERDGQAMTADVTLLRLEATAFGRALLRNRSSLFQLWSILGLALFAFLLRPGNHGARYLFLAFAGTVGQLMNQSSHSFYRTSFPPMLHFMTDFFSVSWAWFFLPSLTLFVLVFPVRQWPLKRFPRMFPALLYSSFILLAAIPIALTVITRIPSGKALSGFGTILLVATFFGATIGSLANNWLRVRDPIVRAQLRWLVLGFALGIAFPVLLVTLGDFLFPDTPLHRFLQTVSSFSPILLAVSLAIGILRYRLFDIDVIIRRTTSYAIITGLLALVYLASIVVLQTLLGRLTNFDSTPAVVLSTLLIAALFLPVRRRVQDIIDRRFNRTRYDAEKTLAAFAATARDETDLDALLAELQRVIQETMQPESIGVWLYSPETYQEWSRVSMDRSNQEP
jgi:hypothetical protein